jgi:hypothetical protein
MPSAVPHAAFKSTPDAEPSGLAASANRPAFTPELGDRFARVALAGLATEYPYHLTHLLAADADARPPRALHPAFWGSYDWHSSVHMQWTLARCLRLAHDIACASRIAAHFDARLVPVHVDAELAYLRGAGRASFERPYGWGWLLKLQSEFELLARERDAARRWRDALAPLADDIVVRLLAFLPRLDYPVRAGTHGNTAFALLHALDYARTTQHRALARSIAERTSTWFGRDCRYPADYEPGGDDFLSGGLVEAVLVKRTADAGRFADWWDAFVPAGDALGRWLVPVRVSDARDPKIVHLHGLNLSRAWCWRALRPALPSALHESVDRTIESHFAASAPAAVGGDFVGTHWLASFALLALTDAQSGDT